MSLKALNRHMIHAFNILNQNIIRHSFLDSIKLYLSTNVNVQGRYQRVATVSLALWRMMTCPPPPASFWQTGERATTPCWAKTEVYYSAVKTYFECLWRGIGHARSKTKCIGGNWTEFLFYLRDRSFCWTLFVQLYTDWQRQITSRGDRKLKIGT